MSSNINPNNIDTTYPVAGQDNDSQGFRDNFTNIKTNFEYAETEIDDLQSKVLLKSALTGGSLDNNLSGALISSAKYQDFRQTRVAIGTVGGGTATVDYSAGHYQTVTLGGSATLAFSNFPANTTNTANIVRLQVTPSSTAYTLTFPSSVTVNSLGLMGYNSSTRVLTFPVASIAYEFEFVTNNGGTTITVNECNKQLSTFTNSKEDLAASAAANLAVTTSYFSTAAAETATLAAGVEGQVKVFAMYSDSGDMVITVSNAGWKTSGTGTITFSDIGQTVSLMYINSKWFAIGQGAGVADTLATFA
jgi:hypothetical protein